MVSRIPLFAKLAGAAGAAGLLALGALGAAPPAMAASTGRPAAQPGSSQAQDLKAVRRQVALVVFGAEASVLGIKPEQLRADLRQGRTVAQLAQAKGMDEQRFGQAVAQAAKPGLDKLVDSHRITAAQAARVEQRLSSGHVPWWNGRRRTSS